jgi:ferredoxin-NADP reductase
MRLKLIEKRQEAPDIYTFIFEPEKTISWQAGQYMIYTLPHADMDDRKDKRFFSIASAPRDMNIWLTTRFSPDKSSTFKKALKDMAIGSEIQAEGPSGGFTAGIPEEGEIFFIAGGIGITPIRSILIDLESRGKKIKGTLLYASRDNNIVFKNELVALASHQPDFKISYIIDPERITEETIRQSVSDPNKPVYYVSGPEPMVEAMEKTLAGLGVAGDKIKRDYFPGYDKI